MALSLEWKNNVVCYEKLCCEQSKRVLYESIQSNDKGRGRCISVQLFVDFISCGCIPEDPKVVQC